MSIASSTPLPTLLFAAFATIAVTGCGINVRLDDDTTRRIEHDTVQVDGLTRLELRTDNGAVEIRGGGGDEIAVRTVLQESNEGDADSSIDMEGDDLVITGECDGPWFDNCSVGFIVTVPSDFDLDVATDNGRIEITDVDGDVRIETDNGAITADRLGSSTVDARTDNGRVRLIFDGAPMSVDAHTDNGAIAVRLPNDDASYAVDADSDNGRIDVDVRTDPSSDRHVHATSDNGAIEVEYRSA